MGRKYARWLVVASLTVLPLVTAEAAFAQYTITTLAKSTSTVVFGRQNGIAADSSGNVYAPASVPQVVVMKVNASGSAVVVGSTQANAPFPGCGMLATSIGMTDLGGVAVDASGNLYVAQSGNGPVLRVSGGTVTCLDGGKYIGAVGIAADNVGDVWVSLGSNGNTVYEITSGGAQIPGAGTGAFGCSGGALGSPQGLAVDNSGNLYIADPWCSVVWKLTPSHSLTVFAGIPGNGGSTGGFSGDGGPATSANLNQPDSVAVDANGIVYIADQANNRIRRVSNGIIATIAGNGLPGYTGDGGAASTAELSHPFGIAASPSGAIYFTDQTGSTNPVIRQLTPPPFGSFDTPIDMTGNVVGAIAVTGWALDSIGVTHVDIFLVPVAGLGPIRYIGTANFVTGARPDVQMAYPNYPNANRAGWGYQLLTNFLPGGGNGTYKLSAVAYDAVGNATELGAPGKIIICTNATSTKPFGTIDTPIQGGTASGTQFVNFGWALTPGASFMIPTDGSTLTVFVDGVPLAGHPVYNNYRSDIATLFPGYTNSQGAVGYYVIDTTKFTNAVHTISWTAFDNGGRGEGLGSRYFSIMNGAASTVPAGTTLQPMESQYLKVRVGYYLDREPELRLPDDHGIYSVELEELDRVELHAGALAGYALMRGEPEDLPIGSTLKGGVFYWQLGPGFLGEYNLLFERPGLQSLRVRITVKPKHFGEQTR